MNEINFDNIVRYKNDVLKVKELVKFTFKQLDYLLKSKVIYCFNLRCIELISNKNMDILK